MDQQKLSELESLLPIIPNHPKPGINFRDISPFLRNVEMRNWVIDELTNYCKTIPIDIILGFEARGFIIGSLLADRLGIPFVMGRKPSSLPGKTEKIVYQLEYATACLEIQVDCIKNGQRVLPVDDFLATGGTMMAAYELVRRMGGKVEHVCCVAEIPGLGGYEKLAAVSVKPFCLLSLDRSQSSSSSSNPSSSSTSSSSSSNPSSFPPHSSSSNPSSFPPHSSSSNPSSSLSSLSRTSLECRPCDAWKTRKPFTLLYHSSMQGLAKEIQRSCPELFEMEKISWESFPDGYANIHFPGDLVNKRIVFLASLFDKTTFMDQLSVMKVLPRQGIRSLYILLPYYAPGTMERVEQPGTLATADTYAQIISCGFPQTIKGPPTLSIFDLHNGTTRFSFTDNVRFWSMSAVPSVLREIKIMCGKNKFAIVFPDEGSWKRFRGLMSPDIITVVCGKMRDGDKRVVTVLNILPPETKIDSLDHAIIVDDLIQTGGTIHECHMALKKLGIKRVSASCTHAVFPRRAYLNFFPGGEWEGLENFWITDSIPANATLLSKHKPFKIISLAPTIVKDLQKHYNTTPTMDLSVAVASENKDKLDAVRYAFEELFPLHNLTLKSHECDSKVSAQPNGLVETIKGATNRLSQLCDDCDFKISLENGVDPDTKEDFAVVVIESKDGKRSINISDKVKIDQDIWQEYLKNPSTTCGKIYNSLKGYDASNWHLQVCGKSRTYLLKEAIIQNVKNMLI
jgi:adenine phosphoribosyltransferase